MSVKLGGECKMYWLSTGTRAAWPATGAPANLILISHVRDVGFELNKAEVEVNDRASLWDKFRGGHKSLSIDFELKRKASDTFFTALRDAFLNEDTVAVALLNTAKNVIGAEGPWADFAVLKFQRKEGLADTANYDVTIKPGDTDVEPEWVTIATT